MKQTFPKPAPSRCNFCSWSKRFGLPNWFHWGRIDWHLFVSDQLLDSIEAYHEKP